MDLIDASAAKNPKLMLRRTESVVEKMLTNWMSICMYSCLRVRPPGDRQSPGGGCGRDAAAVTPRPPRPSLAPSGQLCQEGVLYETGQAVGPVMQSGEPWPRGGLAGLLQGLNRCLGHNRGCVRGLVPSVVFSVIHLSLLWIQEMKSAPGWPLRLSQP